MMLHFEIYGRVEVGWSLTGYPSLTGAFALHMIIVVTKLSLKLDTATSYTPF